LEKPEIKADKNWFHIIFKRPELQESTFEDRIRNGALERVKYGTNNYAPANAPVNGPVKLSKLQTDILNEVKQDETVTYNELSERLRKDRTTIRRNIQKLKEMNLIERIGSDKNGSWKVVIS
jgi:predicted HTH transcriptional regulator